MLAHAAQQQVFGGRLAMLAEHDEIAVLLLLVLDDALRGIPFDDAGLPVAGLQAAGDRRMVAVTLQYLSEARLHQGDPDAALLAATDARAAFRGLQELVYAGEGEGLIARCESRLGRADAARGEKGTLPLLSRSTPRSGRRAA